MASYTFRWAHPAEEVYVTGTFDNWSKSEKMPKVGDVFEKSVQLPDSSDKIYYKFVVDGTWTTNTTDAKEKDEGGNENNVLTPEAILASLPAVAAIMSSNVTADSTTAQLAKDVPLEKDNKENKPETFPGSFPETPAAAELNNPIGINPLPAAAGGLNPIKLAPGEPVPKDLQTADANSNVKLDPESYENADTLPGNNTFSVNPLPAAAGGLNPIKLAPGEPVPKDLQAADLNSNVKLDAESYEKADTLPGVDTNQLNIPLVGGTMIPESSLPMGNGGVNINSVGANATTASLAAEVPLEPKVPDIVKESQEKAGVDPEASGIAAEVEEKKQVEEELKDKVAEAPSTSEGTGGKGTDKSEGDKTYLEAAAAGAAALGAGAAAYVYAAKDKAVELAAQAPTSVQEKLPLSVQETLATATKETKIEEVSPEVPAEVRNSIVEASRSPEAAANTAAVEEKAAVEAELLKEVKTVNATGEPAPKPDVAEEPVVPATTTQEAPKVVEPPAVANDVAETSAPSTEANGATAVHENGAGNGAGNGAEPAAPATPAKSTKTDLETPGSSKSDQKKKNRVSGFFGKLKAKISHKEGN